MTKYRPVDERWKLDANCRGVDPSLMIPEKAGSNEDTAAAKAVCAGCAVRPECLAYGLNEKVGIFGGLTYTERKKLKRSMREQVPA